MHGCRRAGYTCYSVTGFLSLRPYCQNISRKLGNCKHAAGRTDFLTQTRWHVAPPATCTGHQVLRWFSDEFSSFCFHGIYQMLHLVHLFASSFVWCQIINKICELLFKMAETTFGKIYLKTLKNGGGCVWAKTNSHFRFHGSTFKTRTHDE